MTSDASILGGMSGLRRILWVLLMTGCVLGCEAQDGAVTVPAVAVVVPEEDATEPADTTPDVEVTAPDAEPETADDAAGPEVSEDVADPNDAEEPVDGAGEDTDVSEPDTTIPPEDLPDKVLINCLEDSDCQVSCGSGGTCIDQEESDQKICRFDNVEGCLIPDESNEYLVCYDAADTHPDTGCIFCNPRIYLNAWSGTIIRESFEQGKGWFGEVNEFVFPPTASWTSSEERAAAGAGSLYFGDPFNLTYQTADKAEAEAVSVPIKIPDGIQMSLSFQLWLETEELPGYDLLTVLLFLEDGTKLEIWNSDAIGGTTNGVFLPIQPEVPLVPGQWIRLGFNFNTIDHLDNDYEGVYIDNVALVTGCCNDQGQETLGAVDCDDGNPCTVDLCPTFGEACVNEPIADCCNTPLDCDDGDACTVSVCAEPGASCSFEPVDGCCHETADCNDDNPCTEDVCPEDGGQCLHTTICCESDADCDDGDPCTDATCNDEQCYYEFTCCLSNAECNDGDYCTTDQCIAGDCMHSLALLPGCCAPEIYIQNFDNGAPPGWSIDPLVGGVGWSVAEVSKFQSGPGVLYYGDPNAEDFDNGAINEGSATTGVISLPSEVEIAVEFDVYFEGESSLTYDKFTMEVKGPGSKKVLVTKSDITVGNWKHIKKDLSYLAGEDIQLTFHFETVDNLVNSAFGLAIDNLAITTTCEKKTCTSNQQCGSQDICLTGLCESGGCTYVNGCCDSADECEDDNVCTLDSCVTALCSFDPIPNCCQTVADCDDGNPCTVDFCSGYGGECSHEPIGGCCLSHSDCDDGDTCTQNLCDENVCSDIWICCADDSECDDGDDVCTDDTCVDSFCSFQQTGAEGCCESNPVTWDFETPVNWSYTANAPPCGWQVISTSQAVEGSHVLYYGDPGAMNFDCGTNEGTATSEMVTLLPGVDYQLTFKLFQDTESGTTYDKLWMYVLVDGKKTTMWTKQNMSPGAMGSWTSYSFDVSGLAGKTVQFQWEFDSHDGVINDKLGVMVDAMKIISSCEAVSCTNDADCSDDISSTTGTCSPTGCTWSL